MPVLFSGSSADRFARRGIGVGHEVAERERGGERGGDQGGEAEARSHCREPTRSRPVGECAGCPRPPASCRPPRDAVQLPAACRAFAPALPTLAGAARGSASGRAVAVLAALVCLFFIVTLRDVALFRPLPPSIPAPLLPASVLDRDAALAVTVVDEASRPLTGASVRVFAMRDGKGYFAGDHNTDGAGARLVHEAPPRAGVGARLRRGAGAGVVPGRAGGGPAGAAARPASGAGARRGRGRRVRAPRAPAPRWRSPPPIRSPTPPSPPQTARRASTAWGRLRTASAPGRRATTTPSAPASIPGATPLRIRLERPAALVVAVVTPDGKPAAGATVLAAGTGLWPARSTVTGDAGTARIGGLHGGVYDLKARLGDLVSRTEVALPVKRGEARDGASSRSSRAGACRVTVTDGDGDGAPPVKAADVVLVEEGLSSFPLQGRTGADGIALLGPLARGPRHGVGSGRGLRGADGPRRRRARPRSRSASCAAACWRATSSTMAATRSPAPPSRSWASTPRACPSTRPRR